MPAPVWKGYLSFGLVNFPIRLYSAARAESVHFHLLHKKDLSRLKEVFFCAQEDRPVDRADTVKGYEYEKDQYIVVEPEELEQISPPTATVMEILQFVCMKEIDPIFFETSYYVAPEEAVQRPYALLLQAMKETGYDALAKLTMHGREHIVILRPRERAIMLHTMFFVDELHRQNEVEAPSAAKFDKKELDLARKLVETLASPFKPQQYRDEYRKNVEDLIEKKRSGKKVKAISQPKAAPVTDLMKALEQSLAQSQSKQKLASHKPKKVARKRSDKVA